MWPPSLVFLPPCHLTNAELTDRTRPSKLVLLFTEDGQAQNSEQDEVRRSSVPMLLARESSTIHHIDAFSLKLGFKMNPSPPSLLLVSRSRLPRLSRSQTNERLPRLKSAPPCTDVVVDYQPIRLLSRALVVGGFLIALTVHIASEAWTPWINSSPVNPVCISCNTTTPEPQSCLCCLECTCAHRRQASCRYRRHVGPRRWHRGQCLHGRGLVNI